MCTHESVCKDAIQIFCLEALVLACMHRIEALETKQMPHADACRCTLEAVEKTHVRIYLLTQTFHVIERKQNWFDLQSTSQADDSWCET